MMLRGFKGQLAAMVTGVALIGCSGGSDRVEPAPSPEGVRVQEAQADDDVRQLEETGADAGLPPEQRTQE
jgi:hypothetical protein